MRVGTIVAFLAALALPVVLQRCTPHAVGAQVVDGKLTVFWQRGSRVWAEVVK